MARDSSQAGWRHKSTTATAVFDPPKVPSARVPLRQNPSRWGTVQPGTMTTGRSLPDFWVAGRDSPVPEARVVAGLLTENTFRTFGRGRQTLTREADPACRKIRPSSGLLMNPQSRGELSEPVDALPAPAVRRTRRRLNGGLAGRTPKPPRTPERRRHRVPAVGRCLAHILAGIPQILARSLAPVAHRLAGLLKPAGFLSGLIAPGTLATSRLEPLGRIPS